jgi:hypothetical protein
MGIEIITGSKSEPPPNKLSRLGKKSCLNEKYKKKSRSRDKNFPK